MVFVHEISCYSLCKIMSFLCHHLSCHVMHGFLYKCIGSVLCALCICLLSSLKKDLFSQLLGVGAGLAC